MSGVFHLGEQRFSFEQLSKLQVGDTVFECEYGAVIETKVKVAPTVTNDGYEGRRHVQFIAAGIDGHEIKYASTEGLDHYGPKLYPSNQYITRADLEKVVADSHKEISE